MYKYTEKKLLQAVVALGCVVPILAGAGGAAEGSKFLGFTTLNFDSHFRYLSGLLLGIGFGFASTIPHIEKHKSRFRLLTLIVVVGGLCRLLGIFLSGMPDKSMLLALGMELVVTPLLCLWQRRIARRF